MSCVEFLNVDLDLESNSDLSILIDSFGENVVVMKHQKGAANSVSLELAGLNGSPNYLISEYAKLLESLSTEARAAWDSCTQRRVDLGFECSGVSDGTVFGITEHLSTESIELLARFNIAIALTIYSTP